jgi:hypothetical protein
MNREAERKRLVELIKDSLNKHIGKSCLLAENIASDLLSNGIVVPPVKVGQTVYELDNIVDKDKCENCEHYYEGGMGDSPGCLKGSAGFRARECIDIVETIATLSEIGWWIHMNDFGVLVFTSREEAEKMLEGEEK